MVDLKNNPRITLDPKITELEIEENTYNQNEHVGKSKHFKHLFALLVSLRAFGFNITSSNIADLIYEHSSFLESSDAQSESGKNSGFWGDRRFEKLRYGRASFTKREASYIYDVFLNFFGKEWAKLFTPASLVLNSLESTLKLIQDLGLPATWTTLNPVHSLKIISAMQSDTELCPAVAIQYTDSTRISKQSDQEPKLSKVALGQEVMPVGATYYLYVEQGQSITIDMNILVFEYAENQLSLDGVNEPVQAQLLKNVEASQATQLIGADHSRPLEIMNHLGNFGYCVISYPSEWDVQEAFDLPDDDWWTVSELQKIVKKIRLQINRDNQIKFSLWNYVVESL